MESIATKERPQPRRLAAAKQPKQVSSDESDGDGMESEDIIFIKMEPAPRSHAAKALKVEPLRPVTGKVSPVSKLVILPFS